MGKKTPSSIVRIVAKARPKFDHEPGVVGSSVYKSGEWIADIPVAEAGAWAKKPAHVVWLGLYEPSDDLLRRVQREFNLHDLAIEDALRGHQRPKIEQYGEGLFIVARTAQMFEGRIQFGETARFRRPRLRHLRSSWRFDLVFSRSDPC